MNVSVNSTTTTPGTTSGKARVVPTEGAVPAIDARAITKDYGDGGVVYRALKGVDLRVHQGEFLMLVGPSGSGKTTLLSIIGCVLRPTSGELRVFGETVSGLRESQLPEIRLGNIGFIFQGHNLIASMSARENVALVNRLRGAPTKDALEEAHDLLDKVGLQGKGDKKPGMLSGGERQRVAIARALAGHPPIVLADEPTASLDANSGLVVTTLLKELSQELGTTVLVVTHDNRIFHLADRIVNIEDGLIKDGTSEHP
jgi:putative ABC transport system ATP-binding protein